jgi:hypothetical protein
MTADNDSCVVLRVHPRYFIFFLASLLPLVACSQEYTLSGLVHIKNVESCRYQVAFTISHDRVTGHSTTWPQETSPLHATIEGHLDRKHRKLSFSETKMNDNSQPDACMFHVNLSYSLVKGVYFFNGTFTGKDLSNKFCDEGDVSLTTSYTPGSPFENIREKPSVAAPKREAEAVTKTELGHAEEFPQIAAGETRRFDWSTDSCTIDVWDGGVIDNDRITLTFNGQSVLSGYVLTGNKKHLVLPLAGKINVIRITAENEGTTPPNTAKVYLWDGLTRHPVLTYLEKGTTAVIEVRKK